MNKIYFFLVIITFNLKLFCNSERPITIAILAKDKAHCLPLYLLCLELQTWPKNKTNIYIRTNNNRDETVKILRDWVEKVKDQYLEIYFDDSSVTSNLEKYEAHEWNCERFKILGDIRGKSIKWAQEHNSHYFVADCDNFITPQTIESIANLNLPIVAPILHCHTAYSNFHGNVDINGYYADWPYYMAVINQELKGILQVGLVHCTYFVNYNVIDKLTYDDQSYRYEYVIFSDSARKNGIFQYLDCRESYGYITFASTETELVSEPWFIYFTSKIHDFKNK